MLRYNLTLTGYGQLVHCINTNSYLVNSLFFIELVVRVDLEKKYGEFKLRDGKSTCLQKYGPV